MKRPNKKDYAANVDYENYSKELESYCNEIENRNRELEKLLIKPDKFDICQMCLVAGLVIVFICDMICRIFY